MTEEPKFGMVVQCDLVPGVGASVLMLLSRHPDSDRYSRDIWTALILEDHSEAWEWEVGKVITLSPSASYATLVEEP